MAKDPAFPFYASDWLGSTKRAIMSLAEQGAYVNLLCHQWNDPSCSLPDDDEALAALSGLGVGWLKGGCHLVRGCFPKHPGLDGRIANPRLLEIRAERDEWRRKSSEGGRKSAAKRRAKRGTKRTSSDMKGGATTVGTKGATKGQPKGNSPSPSPSPSPAQEEEAPRAASLFEPSVVHLPDGLHTPQFRQAWSEWCKHRREIQKKLTPTSVARQLKSLETMGPVRAVAAIEHTIEKGWTGIREPDSHSDRPASAFHETDLDFDPNESQDL